MLHLHLVLLFEVLYLPERLVFEVSEVLLPLIVEVLQLGVSNLDVFGQLSLLDVLAEIILVQNDVLLELANLAHQVLEHLILQDVTQLLCEKLHLSLDQ